MNFACRLPLPFCTICEHEAAVVSLRMFYALTGFCVLFVQGNVVIYVTV